MSLFLYISDPKLKNDMSEHLSKHRYTDSGLDLLCPQHTLDFSKSKIAGRIGTGIVFAALSESGDPAPYLLLARSSTSLTPLRMSNQIGLADAGYRGELIARVDCVVPEIDSYEIEHGRRLFQVVQHNWLPWKSITIVNSLDELPSAPDSRGSGGFGSTGK